MQAKTIKGSSPEEIYAALQQLMNDGFKPTLAFVFITNIADAAPLSELMDKESIAIFGVSTIEKFTEQGVVPDDIVALLSDVDSHHFKVVLKDYKDSSAYEAAQQTGEIGINTFNNPGFIISSVDNKVSGEDSLKGLMDAAGNDVTAMGGVAGNPANFSGVVFTNNLSCTRGLIALIINQDKIAMSGLAVSGWKPAGTQKKITKSEASWIYTIDDEPALHVVQKFLGHESITFNEHAEGQVPLDAGAGYPLQFQKASGTPVMKPMLLWNSNDKSILIGGKVKEGDTFRFSLPPDFDVIDTVVESSRIIKEKSMPDADALLVFSCVGRLGSFGPMISTEIEGLAATWNKPMIGFFSLGEFGKLQDSQCEFHGTTVSWVALKEK